MYSNLDFVVGLNYAISRMELDISAAFELFGDLASKPGRLRAEFLIAHDFDGALDGSLAGWPKSAWTARSARLLEDVAGLSDDAIRRCAAAAFDDLDDRVRGLAWCILAEFEHDQITRPAVDAILGDEYRKRIAPSGCPPGGDHDARFFAEMVWGTVLCAASAQTRKQFEQAYLQEHGPGDARAIEACPPSAADLFTDSNRHGRLAALYTVWNAGTRPVAAREAIYQLMIGDHDPEVRVAAIVAYGKIFRNTSDANCLRDLAGLVLTDSQPVWHRFVAYNELFNVCGRPISEHPMTFADQGQLARLRDDVPNTGWPVSVDWQFVNQCKNSEKGISPG